MNRTPTATREIQRPDVKGPALLTLAAPANGLPHHVIAGKNRKVGLGVHASISDCQTARISRSSIDGVSRSGGVTQVPHARILIMLPLMGPEACLHREQQVHTWD
jgi:hypothetical protein